MHTRKVLFGAKMFVADINLKAPAPPQMVRRVEEADSLWYTVQGRLENDVHIQAKLWLRTPTFQVDADSF